MNEGQPVTSADNGANFTCLVANPAIQVFDKSDTKCIKFQLYRYLTNQILNVSNFLE